jgi:DNA-binding response OmpR family regulator
MAVTPRVLSGKRVLIVEDEFAVALMIEDFLIEFGCATLGPCNTVAKAMRVALTENFDLAVLDVNLNGERIYPVADALAKRGIPFLFVSGYGDSAILPGHSDWKVCAKPFTGDVLASMLACVLSNAGVTSPGLTAASAGGE